MLVELGYSSGIEKEIGVLADDLDNWNTGAGHSADSWKNFAGFSSGYYHFLALYSATDYGTYVRITVKNWALVDAFSGTLYYEIRDIDQNVLASGGQSISSIAYGQVSGDYDLSYSAGTPAWIYWRWETSQSWQQFGVL